MSANGKLDRVAAAGHATTNVNKPVNRPKKVVDKCIVCRKKAKKLKQCSSCHAGKYCSSKCFKRDWKTHKPICSSINVLQKSQNLQIRYEEPTTPKQKRKLAKLPYYTKCAWTFINAHNINAIRN